MRVLITGAHGQLGRALIAAAPADAEVLALGRAQLDIGDEPQVCAAVRTLAPDVIINAAAYTAVDRAESEPELAWRSNAHGPRHLARAAEKSGASLLHVSTDFVFDGTSPVPYAPDAPTRPLSVYGRTKAEGELAVLERLGERAAVLRTSWVYAPAGANFVRTMLRLMRERGAVRVVADQVGTPTAAHTVAQALWALCALPRLGVIHHWSDAGVASWYDFAVAVAEEGALLGLLPAEVTVTPIATADYPTAARRPAYSVLDKRATAAALGLPVRHWRASLRTVLEELRHA